MELQIKAHEAKHSGVFLKLRWLDTVSSVYLQLLLEEALPESEGNSYKIQTLQEKIQ